MTGRYDRTTASIEGLKEKATRYAVRGVVAKEIAQGLVLGAVLLTLTGLALALAKLTDPAVAFLGLGVLLLALVAGGAVFATRVRNQPRK